MIARKVIVRATAGTVFIVMVITARKSQEVISYSLSLVVLEMA